MSPNRYHIVFNPLAAGGAAAGLREELLRKVEEQLGPYASLCVVDRPHEASSSTQLALRRGVGLVIAIGGDGTVQEVVNGIIVSGNGHGNGHASTATLGVVSTGTGCGFAQSLGIPRGIAEQLALIRNGNARRVDIALVSSGDGSAEGEQYCINECQFGIGGTVVRRVSGRIKRLGGKKAFGIGAAVAALTQRPHRFALSFDDGPEETHILLGLVIANGAFTGGGMQLVPGADSTDGLLDALLIHDMTVPQRLRSLARIYKGTHVQSDSFSLRNCRRMLVRPEEGVDCEADGELLSPGSRSIRVLTGAINVITAEGGES